MKTRFVLYALISIVLLALVGGCASSSRPSFAEAQQKLPILPTDHGRVFFYRTVEPDYPYFIWLNGKMVHQFDKSHSFTFMDLQEGTYEFKGNTNVPMSAFPAYLRIKVTPGEAQYVRFSDTPDVYGIRPPALTLTPSEQAQTEISDCFYNGPSQ